jgi:hypothetical protein
LPEYQTIVSHARASCSLHLEELLKANTFSFPHVLLAVRGIERKNNMQIISTHKKINKFKYNGTQATPLAKGKKRVMAIVGNKTVHIDVDA